MINIKKYGCYIIILIITLVAAIATYLWETRGEKAKTVEQLERNRPGEGEYEAEIFLEAKGILAKQPFSIVIQDQKLTQEEIKNLFTKAKKELEKKILGSNDSPDQIKEDVSLPQTVQGGLVDVIYYFKPDDIIGADGTIDWNKIEGDSCLVEVSAEMSCQEQNELYAFYLRMVPPELDEQSKLIKEIKTKIKEENDKKKKADLSLPKEVQGYQLTWYKEQEPMYQKIILLGVICVTVQYLLKKKKSERAQQQRNLGLTMDYPDIVSQLSLLTGAGMTVSKAWSKLAKDYKAQEKDIKECQHPGYEEMLITYYEMQDGIGEITAYERFGERCGQSAYRKLSSILTQNVRQGARGMQQLLDAEARDAFVQRKLMAKKLGEEAGTKLLVPMGMMLVLVFVLLMVPAGLSLSF